MGQVLWNKKTGEAYEYEHVDAREILANSSDIYSETDPTTEKPAKADESGSKGGRLSKAEIIEDLTRLEIEHDPEASWATLNALLNRDKAKREANVNASVEG